MKKSLAFLVLILLLLVPGTALAQDYYFQVESETVHAYWRDDGSLDLIYEFVFINQPEGHSIEYVDVGLPNYQYNDSDISAFIDGKQIYYITSSEYEGQGSGVAVGLGSDAIPPGGRGTVQVFINGIEEVLYPDTEADEYASAVFEPTNFGSRYVTGTTDTTVVFHLPPSVQSDEPRWHASPSGFSSAPVTGRDSNGLITYTWRNPQADISRVYKFGASFPSTYVPETAIYTPNIWQRLGISPEKVTTFVCFSGFFLIIVLIIVVSVTSTNKRKLKYLPPKIRIEGHGIKRGLTAIEAAILLERPPDKIFTMILFSLIQKNAAQVVSKDPLKLEFSDPLPKDLRKYETQFVEAYQNESSRVRKTALQDLMIDLIKSVGKKMEGFSHRESLRYYEDIIKRAWQQVEDADTPEVKSEKYNDHMGWTMLDGDFESKTQDAFGRGPVYVPIWWHRYDPTYTPVPGPTRSAGPGGKVASPSRSSGPSLPVLPGGDFAASMVDGITSFSSNVVGNITDFTSRITQKTNPIPKPSSSSSSRGGWSGGGGSSSCACACACAGCACACAGGGR